MAKNKTEEKLIAKLEKTQVKTRGSKTASLEQNHTASKAETSQMLANILYWRGYEIVKSDEECAERLTEFFERIIETGEIPTVEKMSLALGTTRKTVHEWENRGDSRGDLIKKAKEVLASFDAEMAANGKIDRSVYIFRSKNFFGMKDVQDVVITPNNPLGNGKSAEELQEAYLESIGGDVIVQD